MCAPCKIIIDGMVTSASASVADMLIEDPSAFSADVVSALTYLDNFYIDAVNLILANNKSAMNLVLDATKDMASLKSTIFSSANSFS